MEFTRKEKQRVRGNHGYVGVAGVSSTSDRFRDKRNTRVHFDIRATGLKAGN